METLPNAGAHVQQPQLAAHTLERLPRDALGHPPCVAVLAVGAIETGTSEPTSPKLEQTTG